MISMFVAYLLISSPQPDPLSGKNCTSEVASIAPLPDSSHHVRTDLMGGTQPKVEFTTDLSRMPFDVIYGFLSQSYWSKGLSKTRFARAMKNSINVAAFIDANLVGYARIVTDSATYAYLCDVFVLEPYRGSGISKEMMKSILSLPDIHGIKRFALVTKDAQGLYEKFGFANMPNPAMYMEINRPEIYASLGEE